MFAFVLLCVCSVVFSGENTSPLTLKSKRSFGPYEFPGFGSDYQNFGFNKFDTLAVAPWNGYV